MEKDQPEASLTRSNDADDDDLHETTFSNKFCCFWFPCFAGSGRDGESVLWERVRPGAEDGGGKWWEKGLEAVMKVREWSEMVAGPKWKTFIRRFNKNRTGYHRSGPRKFNYDAVDYAKNFDDGRADCDDEDALRRGFSMRYTSVSLSAKSSVDLGKDGPVFE